MGTNNAFSSRQGVRDNPSRTFGWRGLVILTMVLILMMVLILNILALHHGRGIETNVIDCSHLPPHTTPKDSTIDNNNGNMYQNTKHTDTPSNMTFIGIALNSDRVSDSAIRFLIDAACVHNIKSYILLGEGSNKPLKQKILAMTYHSYLPLPHIDGSMDCINWIRVRTAPSEDVLLNMTRTYIESSSIELKSNMPNNPLDLDNRIAKIKRSREYQRQQLLQNKISWGSHVWDWSYHSVIGVLDLDLFGYPLDLSDVVETASQYVIPSPSAKDGTVKYQAICANGLQISERRRSYYDTFSTILLPNTWLHRESDRVTARGALDGEDFDLAKMSQTQTLKWLLKEGRKNYNHSEVNSGNSRMDGGESDQQYDVVPVRSCFNGFTLYHADVFFDSRCRYDSHHEKDELYISKNERHTCEHIVFNECLRRVLAEQSVDDNFRIAVKLDLLTLWHLLK